MKFGMLILYRCSIPIPTIQQSNVYLAHHSYHELCVHVRACVRVYIVYKTQKGGTFINAGTNTHKTFSLILIEFLNSFVKLLLCSLFLLFDDFSAGRDEKF